LAVAANRIRHARCCGAVLSAKLTIAQKEKLTIAQKDRASGRAESAYLMPSSPKAAIYLWGLREVFHHGTPTQVQSLHPRALGSSPPDPALQVVERDGQRIVRRDMLWGFPPCKPSARYGTNSVHHSLRTQP
jgi:hypothetical protein